MDARPGLTRRALLSVGGASLLAGCGRTDPPRGTRRLPYGDDPSQFGELTRPPRASKGTVVIVHGGFWLSDFDLSLGRPLAGDLLRRGWTTWNLEYRRVGDGGGWPATFEDVAAGIDRLAGLDVPRPVVALGHSAGGQLAVWAASRDDRTPGGPPKQRLDAVVSQSGVLDLVRAWATSVGGTAVSDVLGGTPENHPERFGLVDPIQRVPVDVPVRAVHARDDGTVPLSQSRRYVAAGRRAGMNARLLVVPGDHLGLIDPHSVAWARTRALIANL